MKRMDLKLAITVLITVCMFGCGKTAKVFHEGLAAVEKNGKWGYVDTLNNVIIPYQYDSAGYFTDGRAVVGSNNKIGTIDKSGNTLLKIKYDRIGSFTDGIAIVGNEGKYGFADITGKEIVPLLYGEVKPFEHGLAAAIQNGDTVFVDKNGIENRLIGKWRFAELSVNTVSKGVLELHGLKLAVTDINTSNYMIIRENGDFKSNFSISDDKMFFGKALVFDKNTKWKSANSELQNEIYTCNMELLDECNGLLYQTSIRDKNVMTMETLETVTVPSRTTEYGTTESGKIKIKYEITFKREKR